MFAFVFGWLFGRNIRASRQAARNAALPEVEKQRLFAEQHKTSGQRRREARERKAWLREWRRSGKAAAHTPTTH